MNLYIKCGSYFVRDSGEASGSGVTYRSDSKLAEYYKKNNMTQGKKYCIKSGYILREIAGEYAIIPVDEESLITNAVMTPNETAVFLWKAFQQPCTIEDVVGKGVGEYDITDDVIRNAVFRFVDECLKLRILEEVE